MPTEDNSLVNETDCSQEIGIKITNCIKTFNLTYNTCEINNNILYKTAPSV
jgi:hypothetical protein